MQTLHDSTDAAMFDRLPPHSEDAEQSALGSLILCGDDRVAFASIRVQLSREMFFSADHQAIFEALVALDAGPGAVDAVLLVEELRRRSLLDEVGGPPYIAKLIESVPTYTHGQHYASVVAEHWRRRCLIRVANQILGDAYSPQTGNAASEHAQRAITALWNVSTTSRTIRFTGMEEMLHGWLDRRERGDNPAIKTTLAVLDREYPGLLARGRYTMIAGRPSMGKSTFTRWLLRRIAGSGVRCGLIAIEETEDKIAGNWIASETSIENQRLPTGNWSAEEFDAIARGIGSLSSVPITMTDSASTLSDVLAAMEVLVTQHQCQVIAIDHIHLIGGVKADNEEGRVRTASGSIKAMLKKYNVAGIVVGQLSRPDKKASIAPPTMTDLRASGSLEEHADAIVLIHREDYYHIADSGWVKDGLCTLIIAKMRDGARGQVTLREELKYQRFVEMDDPNQTW